MTTPSNAGGEEKDSSASRASAVGATPSSGGLGWGNLPRFPSIPTTTSGSSSKKARDTYPPPGELERAAVVENSRDSSGTASPTNFRRVVEGLTPLTRNPVEPMSVTRKDPRPRSGAPMHNSHAKPVLRGTPTERGGVSPGFTGSWQNRQDAEEELRTCRQELYTAQARSKTLEAEVDVLRAQVQKLAKERDVARGGEAKSRRRVLELENELGRDCRKCILLAVNNNEEKSTKEALDVANLYIAKLEKGIDCPTPPSRDVTLAEQEHRSDSGETLHQWFYSEHEAFLHHRRIGERVEKEPHLPELFSQWEKEQMRDFLFFVEGWKEHLDGASNSVPVLTDPKDPNKHLCLDELPSAMAADKKGLEKRFRRWIDEWKDLWIPSGVVEAPMGSNSDTNSGGR